MQVYNAEMASTKVPCLVMQSALNASRAELLVCVWGKEMTMLDVFGALLQVIYMVISWFIIGLAIAAGLFIVVLLIIAIYSWLKGDKDDGE